MEIKLLSGKEDGVQTYTQALHEGSIAQADICIAQRIKLRSETRFTTGLVTIEGSATVECAG